jgi:hypothetical protein
VTLYDGMGTYLRIWSDGTWIYVGASMRIQTLIIGYLLYALVGLLIVRYRQIRKGEQKL